MVEGAPCQMPLYSISLEAYAQARHKPSCAGLPRALPLALLPTLGPPARPETELPMAFPGCLPQGWNISLVAHHPWRRVSLFPSHRYIPASTDGERQETQQGAVRLPRGLEQSWPKPQIATKSHTGSGWERRGRKKKSSKQQKNVQAFPMSGGLWLCCIPAFLVEEESGESHTCMSTDSQITWKIFTLENTALEISLNFTFFGGGVSFSWLALLCGEEWKNRSGRMLTPFPSLCHLLRFFSSTLVRCIVFYLIHGTLPVLAI